MGAACTRTLSQRDDGAPHPTPVVLNIYNVGTSGEMMALNRVLRPLGTGAFHCGVEVFGLEWSYGDHQKGTGIFNCRARECDGHTYCESLPMGKTSLTPMEFNELIEQMEKVWLGAQYDVLKRNCCHMCEELCERLGVGAVPAWVTNLASTAATIVVAGETLDKQRRSIGTLLAHHTNASLCCGCDPGHGEEVELIMAPPYRGTGGRYAGQNGDGGKPSSATADHGALPLKR
mmetsp:Transcript_1205/g.3020  ORF Transcript_1205/g.3020 Transcript_1205/m.3020 type:complete len:232 (+) Transcript_1205:127-822(+)